MRQLLSLLRQFVLESESGPLSLSLVRIPSAEQVVDLSVLIRHNPRSMITLLLHVLRLLPFLCGGHHQLALENLALRQQLAVYRRSVSRPRLCPTDRLFWSGWPASGLAGDRR
jgi:hypothetical protein